MIERAKQAIEDLNGIRGARKHKAIWHNLICARWLEACSLAQEKGYAVSTPSGTIALLSQLYISKPKNNNLRKSRALRDFCLELIEEAESGRNVRLELEEVAQILQLTDTHDNIIVKPTLKQKKKAAEIIRKHKAQGLRTEEYSSAVKATAATTHTRGTVLLAPARDPWFRSSTLKNRASELREELPPPDGENRAEWIYYIDELQRRWPAPLSATDIHKISGRPVRLCAAMSRDWRDLLSKGITEDQRRSLALSLSAEAEAIAREALALCSGSDDARVKAAALKLALDSLGRRQSLAGLDKVSLEAKIEARNTSWTEQAAAAGLSPEDLRKIGDITSAAMSKQSLKEK